MPEGHTIHRAARRIRSVLGDKRLDRVEARGVHLVEAKARQRLLGDTVTTVEARGKHLLIHTAGGWSIHSHLRMDGVWHLYRKGEPWKRPRRRAWLVLGAGEWDAVNFDGPILELHRTEDLARDRELLELGPDILVEPFDDAEYLRRMRRNGQREIGDAVMRQFIVAGIGNIYKSESLFMAGISPWRRVSTLTDDKLLEIRQIASRIMYDGVLDARAITYRGPGPEGRWAYSRVGQPCRTCATRIETRKQGEDQRSTFWCPRCQP
ncbi:MAG: DNA-(apurinic or apyrimidinic site) lyase [Thermoleophilia bacterium]|nr:DNA-(apurinic or apyrimidinic site) lyase [Thermoleophilia bacterium]